jgi:hypothetical protein
MIDYHLFENWELARVRTFFKEKSRGTSINSAEL